MQKYHRDTLKLALEETNTLIADYLSRNKHTEAERERLKREQHAQADRDAAKEIKF